MDDTADVVVIGGGAAGLSAAIEAAERGARTLLLETEAEPSGSTRLSAGHCVFCETDLEPGSKAELYDDLLHAHHEDHDEALVRLYVDRAPGAYRRLRELGLVFQQSLKLAHMSRAWAHEIAGQGVKGGHEIGRLLEVAARERGVRILTETRARRLLRDGQGRVRTVLAEQAGREIAIRAERAVVLATGGFTRSPELIRRYGAPGTDRIFPLTGAGSRGDGLTMALGLGADTAYLTIGIAPTVPADPASGKGVLINYAGAVLLNRAGKRFCDESQIYNDISSAALREDDPAIIQIYDATVRAAYMETMWGRVLVGFAEHQADDLDGLLTKLDLDAAEARRTIERYNQGIAAGSDAEFGRRHLVGSSGTPRPIAQPPFYGAVTVPGTTHFNGGLKVDATLRVVDVFGQPIEGLYAAGEIAGGFHGKGYLSGTHVGMALIFGQVAGENASPIV